MMCVLLILEKKSRYSQQRSAVRSTAKSNNKQKKKISEIYYLMIKFTNNYCYKK